jgi:hypothetical protein
MSNSRENRVIATVNSVQLFQQERNSEKERKIVFSCTRGVELKRIITIDRHKNVFSVIFECNAISLLYSYTGPQGIDELVTSLKRHCSTGTVFKIDSYDFFLVFFFFFIRKLFKSIHS